MDAQKIKLTELNGNVIEISPYEIRRYRGTGYGTYIEMHSGTEFRVKEDFDSVDEMVLDITGTHWNVSISNEFKNTKHE